MTLPPDISARVSRSGPIAIAAQTWRNPAQLRDWLDDTFADPAVPDNVKREKAGIFKELVEEVLPLSLFAVALSGQVGLSDADLAFKPVIGSQSYDALARIRQPNGTEEFQIEIVTATRDGEQDSLMLKAISDHGRGSPDATYRRGRGENRVEIHSEGAARSAASLKSELLTAMCAAFKKKNARAPLHRPHLATDFDPGRGFHKPR